MHSQCLETDQNNLGSAPVYIKGATRNKRSITIIILHDWRDTSLRSKNGGQKLKFPSQNDNG